MKLDQIVNSINEDTDEGLLEFGRYTFYDKGPSSVMDIKEQVKKIINLEPKDIAYVLDKVSKHKYHNYDVGEIVVNSISLHMQDIKDEVLDVMFEAYPSLEEFFF